MPTIQKSVSVTTAGTPNLISGSSFEYPQQPMQVSMGLITTATNMFGTIYAGARLIAEEFLIDFVAAAVYPTIPDDIAFNFVILPGERLVIAVRNASGGTLVVGTIIDMQPIG